MLRLLQLEEIERKLFEVSTLIDGYENRNPTFVDDVEKWLKNIDEVLQKNRLAIAGNIAGLRGTLLSVRNGASYQDIETIGRSTRRKLLAATAIDIVNRAVNIVNTSIQGDRIRVNEAERIALQVISVARICGLIKDNTTMPDGPVFAQNLITSMKSTEATVQGVVQLEGLLGRSDVIIVIDRLLNYGFVPERENQPKITRQLR